MRAQTVFQLFVQVPDLVGDLGDLAVIVFEYLVDGRFGDDAFIVQHAGALFAQHRRGHAEERVFEYFLIRELALADLFVKPTHFPHLLSRWR